MSSRPSVVCYAQGLFNPKGAAKKEGSGKAQPLIHRCKFAHLVPKYRRVPYYHKLLSLLQMPGAGFEPAWGCPRGILSPLCIPVPPPGQVVQMYVVSGFGVRPWDVTSLVSRIQVLWMGQAPTLVDTSPYRSTSTSITQMSLSCSPTVT